MKDKAGNRYSFTPDGQIQYIAYVNGDASSLVEIVVGDALGALGIGGGEDAAHLIVIYLQEVPVRGNTSTFAYTDGNLTSATDANGAVTTYTYDRAGNRTSMTDSPRRTGGSRGPRRHRCSPRRRRP